LGGAECSSVRQETPEAGRARRCRPTSSSLLSDSGHTRSDLGSDGRPGEPASRLPREHDPHTGTRGRARARSRFRCRICIVRVTRRLFAFIARSVHAVCHLERETSMSSSTAQGKTSVRRKRATSSSGAPAASSSSTDEAEKDGLLVCPECEKTFKGPAGLGAHRSAAHGVAGSSRRARSNSATTRAGKTGSAKAGTARGNNSASRRGAQATTSRPRSRSSQENGRQLDRDKLLSVLFPQGVPAKVGVIQALTPWLDEAERLSRMR
jgi:hypothetical protein